MTFSRRFHVHVRDEGRHFAHAIAAADPQDAALGFAEHWLGAARGEVRLIVLDGETGEERCFCLDLDDGDVEACG